MKYASERVTPRSYEPPRGKAPRRRIAVPLGLLAGALAVLLAGAAWHAVGQLHVIGFDIIPASATVRVETPHMAVGERFLFWRGPHAAMLEAVGYRPLRVEFEAATEAPRTIRAELEPLPGALLVRTQPAAEGEVWLDGKRVGATGEVVGGLAPGRYVMQVRVPGYVAHRQEVPVEGRGQQVEIEVALKAAAVLATLAVTSRPEGADVLLDGAWKGRTPWQFRGMPGAEVEIVVLHPGHAPDRRTRVLKSGRQQHAVVLEPRYGLVDVRPEPANATVRVNGRVETQRQLRLLQQAQTIEVSAPDHVARRYIVVPHPDEPQRVIAALPSQAQVALARRQQYEQAQGLAFVAFRPYESLELATTRRRIPVRLTRPFAIMDKEVTNALYRHYQAAHDSGEFSGRRLNQEDQPVVRVAWEDAARFANWLSRQAGVAPFYREQDGEVVGFDAGSIGYRLPSEAEWVWLTRSGQRFAWGSAAVPPRRYANLADASAAGLLGTVLKNYDDGFAVSAEVGSFGPSPRKLYDLPGNVAEWMHDVFLDKLQISGQPEAERVNPLGEASGRHHVIRGFGWRDSNQKALSLSHRRYGREPRDDVGFRLAYYLEAP